ncbi:tetratricopeptide repeat protein 39B-like isoform X2 [Corticium candelabrum]|uniref:tetratricopeptide repeat protein 39B-like isoform X2 n=1 Tax=Corticium candelabrum TaxID=121492 RepID=UPI002E26DA4A|nr:tetratricopeptide repeat protein 39B-like isoform X2 [Corticium candelabrum]
MDSLGSNSRDAVSSREGVLSDERMPDKRALEDAACAISFCLDNKFNEAEELLKPWRRKKHGWLKTVANAFTGRKLEEYTSEELHSELVHAECLLLRALLSFIQDENLVSFIKGGLKIRSCFQSYKSFWSMINSGRTTGANDDPEFISGTQMGLGAFNLMVSLLPGRILKILEFIGFSGNRSFGMDQLLTASVTDTLRAPLCSIGILNFDLLITHILGIGDGDIERCETILDRCLRDHPKGAIFLFLSGRAKFLRGFVDEATSLYNESVDAQSQWTQLHHLCYWELIWSHSVKGDWENAAHFSDLTYQKSRWSKTTCLYQKAAFLSMLRDPGEPVDDLVIEMMREVPKHKQRIAGKSIPVEKFAIHKAEKCLAQGNRLMLPGLEILYVWNGFTVLAQCPGLLESVLCKLDAALQYLRSDSSSRTGYLDDLCLVQLLRGICLRDQVKFSDAEECLLDVIKRHKQLTFDPYLAPFAEMELGMLYVKMQQPDKARKQLISARSNYTNFLLESRLHFRVHSALAQLDESEPDRSH